MSVLRAAGRTLRCRQWLHGIRSDSDLRCLRSIWPHRHHRDTNGDRWTA